MSRPRLGRVLPFAPFAVLVAAACNNGGGAAPPQARFVLAAGMQELTPHDGIVLATPDQLQRLGITGPVRTYEVTTPAGVPFAFDAMAVVPATAGAASVAVAHVRDGSAAPNGGPETIAAAGCVPLAPGLASSGNWLTAYGDGFGRITISGAIEREQVFAFTAETREGRVTALVSVAVGARSAINQGDATRGNHPGVVAEDTIYSSDSWLFGQPTCAVSGDRTSVVVYEGSRTNPLGQQRYEMRMQHDRATGAVTGGGSVDAGADRGNWRDHEIAALYNVIAAVRGGEGAATIRLSFDRGATFAQEHVVDAGDGTVRLVQAAMAGDYSLAVAWWRSHWQSGSDLVLLEGRPSAFDATGSPTQFAFDAPQVVYHDSYDVVPLPMGITWSGGGDLVVAHGFTRVVLFSGVTTEFHCAVRPFGGELATRLVAREFSMMRDPSVAVLGHGQGMRVFYACELLGGIALFVSDDAGATFAGPTDLGFPGCYQPAVFAREDQGAAAVDVLYLAPANMGTELHASRWSAFGNSPREDYRLTTSTAVPMAAIPNGGPTTPSYGFRITQVAPFGYDAVRDGDAMVVVVDEERFDTAWICLNAPNLGPMVMGGPTAGSLPPSFSNAPAPPLAPGMTLPLPAPDPNHRHQLRLLRIE